MELFTAHEARVLGALIEKEITTPEYYPLTLRAAQTACNQKNNRYPVLHLEESEVQTALDSLRARGLVVQQQIAGSRVLKYSHRVQQKWVLNSGELAVLAELLLRNGPTVGEIRNRATRMYAYESLERVETMLQALAAHGEGVLTQKLPRETGQKECRWVHLLCGEITVQNPALETRAGRDLADRVQYLEEQVALLKSAMEEIKNKF